MRRGALGDHAFRGQFAGFEDADDLVVVLDLRRIHRLQVAGRPDLLADPVFDVGDIVGHRLGDGALGCGIRIRRRHLERDAEVGLALFGNGIEVRHARAELAQRDRVLRPDRREAGDRARTGSEAGSGRCGLQECAAGYALLRLAAV